MAYPNNGIVAFSITDGMPLTGVYNYQPNPNGPVIAAKQGYLAITRSPQSVDNQWTMFGINVPKPVTTAGGLIYQFNVSYATIQPPTEVKLTLASNLILRYDGTAFNYVYFAANGQFVQLGKSAIAVDGKSHQVTLCFCPASTVIFEDGLFIAKWDSPVAASLQPVFNWQILSAGSSLSAKLSNILIIPPTFEQIVQTPWDIVLTSKWSYPSEVWVVNQAPGNAIPITYSPDYMTAATSSLTTANSQVSPAVAMPLVKPIGMVTYRMRVNASGGSESKITIIGDNILRITDSGKTVLWTLYAADGSFQTLATSSIVVGSGNFTEVTVIYSSNSISLLEDGVYKYTRTYSSAPNFQAVWFVQHLQVNTAISADISNVRCLPLAMSFPPIGTFNIYNFKFNNLVADLSGSLPIGPIIGWTLNQPASANQKWTLTRVSGSTDPNAFVLQNGVASTCFASTPAAIIGALLFGGTTGLVLDINPVPDLGVWSLVIPGSPLAVQLTTGVPGTQLLLSTTGTDDGQKFQLVRA